ncbi:MAG: carboxypeptidase-like regulatory domain-containing protein [Prevotellaceae bacterium]|jgi:hypothetical protein|nr:carboxypeptidase-like regulatory domain-containing protein [Prevotellaceae bacterium]
MKKNWKNIFLRGACLTSATFVFQACYGGPQDFGLDLLVEGEVSSKNTGLPIKGIKVSVANSIQHTYTDEKGSFSFYTERLDSAKIQFEDTDSVENKSFTGKDTLLSVSGDNIYLKIELEEK